MDDHQPTRRATTVIRMGVVVGALLVLFTIAAAQVLAYRAQNLSARSQSVSRNAQDAAVTAQRTAEVLADANAKSLDATRRSRDEAVARAAATAVEKRTINCAIFDRQNESTVLTAMVLLSLPDLPANLRDLLTPFSTPAPRPVECP